MNVKNITSVTSNLESLISKSFYSIGMGGGGAFLCDCGLEWFLKMLNLDVRHTSKYLQTEFGKNNAQ